jgi:hypothetical protein
MRRETELGGLGGWIQSRDKVQGNCAGIARGRRRKMMVFTPSSSSRTGFSAQLRTRAEWRRCPCFPGT